MLALFVGLGPSPRIQAQVAIVTQPVDVTVPSGEPALFAVEATGSSLSFQWYFNFQPIAGETGKFVSFANVQLDQDGEYYVVISNASGAVTSDPARLRVVPHATFTRIMTGPLVTDLGDTPMASIADFDGDGYLDVYANRHGAGPGGESVLYRNMQDGTFVAVANAISPISLSYPQSEWADLDNDGRLDAFVLDGIGLRPNFFAFNNGIGSFTLVELETLGAWSISLVDFDEDGLLDLHVIGGTNWSSRLYRNLGERRFQAVAWDEGGGDLLTAPPVSQFASWADYDDDGRQDLFIASFTNSWGDPPTDYMPCQMFRNEGHGRYLRVTNQITEEAIHGITGAWGDYDNDGRVDLFYCASRWQQTSEWDSFLYRNLGGGRFEHASVGFNFSWGDGAAWGDYDNDGFLDLIMAERPGRGCALFRNNGNGTFFRITVGPVVTTFPERTFSGYGPAWFDYDNDGFLDLFVTNGDDRGEASVPNYLYHNDRNSNAWLKVKLVGAVSNRDAVGAKVRVTATFAGTRREQRREISPGQFLGGNNRVAHFGLGDASIVETLRVEWPSGQVTELHDVAVRQHLTITEAPGLRTTGLEQGTMHLQITAHPGMKIQLMVADAIEDSGVPLMTRPQMNRTDTVVVPDDGGQPRRFYKARVQQ